MTWSKASTTTNSFVVNGTNQGTNNAVSGTGTGVLEEFVTFLGTRGWTSTLTTLADTPTTGDTTWQWVLRKDAVCGEGGTQSFGYVLKYEQNVGTGSDTVTMNSLNIAGNAVASGDLVDLTLGTSTLYDNVRGKWSFWSSDADADSFFVMAEDSSEDSIIGFWPPSGSLFYQAEGSSSYGYPRAGFKPLFLMDMPCWSGNSTNRTLYCPFTDNTYNSYMSDVKLKTDFAWTTNDSTSPMFKVFAGDVSMLVEMGPNGSNWETIASNANANGDVLVYPFGSNYYIAWGLGSKLLFDCGTSAPTF